MFLSPLLLLVCDVTAAFCVVKEDGESNGMPLGAEEEVGSSQHASARTQTLVLMDPDGNTGNLIYDETTGIITEQVHRASSSLNRFFSDKTQNTVLSLKKKKKKCIGLLMQMNLGCVQLSKP